MANMTLRNHPKMKWQGEPVWNPSTWSWLTTIGGGETGPTDGIDRHGKLMRVRQFTEHTSGAAIEILVGFEKAVYSAVIRLDEAEAIADLFTLLDSLHGYSLVQIGEVDLSHSSRILAKGPQYC
jgi:hypothetical protein